MEHLLKSKQNAALDKKWNFSNYGIATFRELINRGNVFVHAKKEFVSSVKYNRIKYNRMSAIEQKAYEEKMSIKKPAYFLYYSESVSTEVAKLVFDYFCEIYPEKVQQTKTI